MDFPDHLLHNNDIDVGYTRIKEKDNFVYYDENSKRVTAKDILRRLDALIIPPAWTEVWICKETNGYLQAFGYDERKRKQYIYHPDWALYRNLDKFKNLYRFGEDLGLIRQQIWQDMSLRGWPKEKVIALAIAIMDETFLRVGNKLYAETNKTYGLTTLRRKHMSTHSGKIKFSFIAKSGVKRDVTLNNKKICKLIKQCSELPGYNVFQYLDDDKKPTMLASNEINSYLKAVTGENYTAKNFRTWGGSVTALECLIEAKRLVEETPRLKLINIVVKKVSQALANTVAVCRKYYIHPAVLSAIEEDITDKFAKKAEKTKKFEQLDIYEKQMMLILKEYYKETK